MAQPSTKTEILVPWRDTERIEVARADWLDLLGGDEDLVRYRLRAEEDCFWFQKHILGFKRIVKPLHQRLIDFCEEGMNHPSHEHAICIPRQCFKSTTCTVGDGSWRLLKNPDLRAIIGSDKDDSAIDFSNQMRRIMARNEWVRRLWPDVVWENPRRDAPNWAADGWTLKRDYDDRVPTMSTMSPESGSTGYHYHLVILDDVVTYDNTRTKTQKKHVGNFIKECFNLRRRADEILPTGGRVRHVFTPWTMDDANMQMLEDDEVPRLWLGIYGEPGKTSGSDEDIIFPQEFTHDSIRRLKKKLRERAPSQLFCSPRTEETSKFLPQWLRWFEPGQHPPVQQLNIYTSVDPNRQEVESGDPISIMTAGWDAQGRIWVLEHHHGHPSIQEMARLISAQCKRWESQKVFVETVGAQLWLLTPLRDRFLFDQVRTRIVQVDRPPVKKDARIMALQAIVETGGVWLPRSKMGRYIERELINYGTGGHDDALDTLADIYSFGRKPDRAVVTSTSRGPSGPTAAKLLEIHRRSGSPRIVMGSSPRVRMR